MLIFLLTLDIIFAAEYCKPAKYTLYYALKHIVFGKLVEKIFVTLQQLSISLAKDLKQFALIGKQTKPKLTRSKNGSVARQALRCEFHYDTKSNEYQIF